jgi:hypothetical protein
MNIDKMNNVRYVSPRCYTLYINNTERRKIM